MLSSWQKKKYNRSSYKNLIDYVCSKMKRVVRSNYPKNNTLRLKLCCHVLVNAVVLLLIVNGILIVPTKKSPRNFAFRGLAAMPRELSNDAFDLLDDELRKNLYEELGIIQPNIIQDTSLPVAFGGNNTFVIAQTGSGKTMAFMLPILQRLIDTSFSSTKEQSTAVVIGPTAELVAQHSTIAWMLMPSVTNRILFKTPQEILNSNVTDNNYFANVNIVAIDEVDAILCGSEFNDTTPETTIKLLNCLPDRAQYILTTAHLTRAHTKIINRLFPTIKTIQQSSSSRRVLVPTLRQVFHYFSGDMSAKLAKLRDVLQKSDKQSTIIFCRDENEVDAVYLYLLETCTTLRDVFTPEKLHVELSPKDRATALARFQKNDNNCQILVTHEIAARGLDCPHVRHVVLFDTPTDVTAFVHRAGRTARAGEEGMVTCLVQNGGSTIGGLGSFGKHHNLHALLDAPKLSFAKATAEEINGEND